MDVVGPVDVVAPRVPLVQVDAAEIHHPEQRGEILDHGEVDDVGRLVLDRAQLDPVRTRRGRALHEEELAPGPVGVALHDHGPVAEMGQQRARDVRVVLEQVALGEAEGRPERLAEVGEVHGARPQLEIDRLRVAREDHAGPPGTRRRAGLGAPRRVMRAGRALCGAHTPSGGMARVPGQHLPVEARARDEPGRPGAAADRAGDGDVGELAALGHAAQEEPSAAHVAPPHEIRGKAEAASEDLTEQIDVLPAGHAAQQDDLRVGVEDAGQATGVPHERPAVAGLVAIDGHQRIPPEPRDVHRLVGPPEPVARGDHDDAGRPERGTGEGARVGELSPEVEPAQEGEGVAERHPLRRAQATGDIERSGLVEEQARPLAAAGGGRQDEESRHGRRTATRTCTTDLGRTPGLSGRRPHRRGRAGGSGVTANRRGRGYSAICP